MKKTQILRVIIEWILFLVFLYILFNLVKNYFKPKVEEGFDNIESLEMNKPNFPIDVVYTWAGEKKDTTDTRQADHNELKYSLRSVNMFMPWVNHIYIMMNPPRQLPSWMKENDKITVVDHHDVFYTFFDTVTNSNALETYIHQIKGLSEHFVYFNDDVFVGRPISHREFFTDDGKAVMPKKTIDVKSMVVPGKKPKVDFELPPFPAWWYPHIPIPRIKSLTEEFQKKYYDYIQWVRGTKKRIGTGCTNVCDVNNLLCPCQQQHFPLAYYMYKQGKGELMVNEEQYPFIKLDNMLKNGTSELQQIKMNKPKFFCFADFGALSIEDRNKLREMITNFSNEYFNIIPDYEK